MNYKISKHPLCKENQPKHVRKSGVGSKEWGLYVESIPCQKKENRMAKFLYFRERGF